MLQIGRDDQRFVEKDFFRLPKRDAVKFPILLKIPIIPIKAGAALERILWRHLRSIYQLYTLGKRALGSRYRVQESPNVLKLSGARKRVR